MILFYLRILVRMVTLFLVLFLGLPGAQRTAGAMQNPPEIPGVKPVCTTAEACLELLRSDPLIWLDTGRHFC